MRRAHVPRSDASRSPNATSRHLPSSPPSPNAARKAMPCEHLMGLATTPFGVRPMLMDGAFVRTRGARVTIEAPQVTMFGARVTTFEARVTTFAARVTTFGAHVTIFGAHVTVFGAHVTTFGARIRACSAPF